MKRNQSKVILSTIVAAVFALLAGCASTPSAEVITEGFQLDSADYKP